MQLSQKIKQLKGKSPRVQSLGDRVSVMLDPRVYELLKQSKPSGLAMHQWARRVVLSGIEIELTKEGVA